MGRKAINLMGRKFGELIVIKRNYPNRNGQAIWLCKCNCGKEKNIRGQSLRNGNIKDCGCSERKLSKTKLSFGIASMRKLIRNYKMHAKERDLEWNLTEEQFKEITQKDCYYCGAKPNNISNAVIYNGNYIYNGIDRIDNNKDYSINNIVPCCKKCNTIKSNLTLQEFKNLIEKIYNKIFFKKI